jgi:hypothetical protein
MGTCSLGQQGLIKYCWSGLVHVHPDYLENAYVSLSFYLQRSVSPIRLKSKPQHGRALVYGATLHRLHKRKRIISSSSWGRHILISLHEVPYKYTQTATLSTETRSAGSNNGSFHLETKTMCVPSHGAAEIVSSRLASDQCMESGSTDGTHPDLSPVFGRPTEGRYRTPSASLPPPP